MRATNMDEASKTDRLREMVDAVARAAQGDHSARIDVSRAGDDLAPLAQALNDLLERVGEGLADRAKAGESAFEDRHLLNFLMEATPDHIYFKDRDSRFVRISKAMAARFGFSDPSQACGLTDFDVFSNEHAQQAFDDEQRIVTAGRPLVGIEEKETWPDGHVTWVSTTKMPLRDKDGNIVGLFGISRDVTDRHRAAEEVRAGEEKVRSILRVAPVGIGVVVNRVLHEVYDNLCEMTGYDRDELAGTSSRLLYLSDEEFERVGRESHRQIEAQERASVQTRWRKKDGGEIDVLLNCALLVPGGLSREVIFAATDISERTRAERELRESRQMLQVVLDTMPVRVFWKDRNLAYLGANRRFLQDAGLDSVDQLIGKNDFEMAWSKYADLYRKDDAEIVRSGTPKLFLEEPYVTADGQERWLRTSKVPLRDASGEIQGVLGFLEDITENKRMEDALRLTQFCFDQASVAILLVGPDAKVVKGNDAACRSLGYAQEELAGLSGLDIDTQLRPEDWEEHRRALRDRASLTHESVYRRRDGSVFPVEVTVSYIEFQNQGFAFTFFSDLTEHKRIEDALRMTQFCVDRASAAVFLVGPDAEIVSVNNRACEVLGYAREELRGMSSYDIDVGLPGEDWTEHRRRLRSEGSVTKETSYRRKDGTEFPAEVTTTYVEYQGQQFGFSFLSDLTERKRAEEEKARLEARLAHSQRMECVGRLAGGVAHDFNNMLSVILGYSELLESGFDEENPLLDDVKQIQKAASRSRDITRQLLAFSRKQIIAPKPVNLNDLIRDTQVTLARLIGEDIDLRFHPEEWLWNASLDSSQFDQVLMNLAVNARDAMPDGGVLTIETANVHLDELYCRRHPDFAPGQYVLLVVSDTGIGMDKEIRSHLFEPFFTTKETGKGTGLGLATVYGIVKQNGGLIDVYSEPGRGTTFRIYFPRMVGREETEKETDEDLVASGAGTVLLVEDDEMVRRLTAKMLETIGYTVLVSVSPDDALALCADRDVPIDLLVTDVVMPTINGAQLRDKVAAMRPGIKSLFMSGYTSDVIVHHGVLEEGVHFVQKPFTMRDLARKVRDAIRA